MQNTWIEISRSKYRQNISVFKKIVNNDCDIGILLKSNAYGHGFNEIAALAEECRIKKYFVFTLKEALEFRRHNKKDQIIVMGPVYHGEYELLVKNNVEFVLTNIEALKSCFSYFKNKRQSPKLHIKFDSGFNRQGIKEHEINELKYLLKNNGKIKIRGLMTHFSVADESSGKNFTEEQINKFNKFIKNIMKEDIFVGYCHSSNTAATMLYKNAHMDTARIGIGQFGLWPSEDAKYLLKKMNENLQDKNILNPIMTWKTNVVQIKDLKKGESIGYGRTYKSKKRMKIGVLPVGYSDGLDRGLSNKGKVIVSGKKADIIGRISMNLTTIDITNIHEAKMNDEVVILGKQGMEEISADDMARQLSTINYEIVTRINWEIPRIVID